MHLKQLLFPTAVTLALGIMCQAASAATINIDKCQRISTPGTYVLTKDIDLIPPAGGCFDVTADNVTLDLGGHTLRGNHTHLGTPAYYAVHATAHERTVGGFFVGDPLLKLTVRNGFIVDFVTGLALEGTFGAVVENMQVTANSGDGIRVDHGALLQHITAIQNHGSGVVAGAGSYVNDTDIQSSGKDGLFVREGSTVYNVSSIFNVGRGIVVDRTHPQSRVLGDTAEGNKGNGIDVLCSTIVGGNNTGQFFPNGGEAVSLFREKILIPNIFITHDCGGNLHGAIQHDSDGIVTKLP